MRRFARAALCAFAVAAPALARAGANAADDFDADRPDVSESPRALETGRWQLEAGSSWAGTRGHASGTDVGEGLLRWGVARNLELRGALPTWYRRTPAGAGSGAAGAGSGFGDSGIGFKATLPRSSRRYAAGIVFDLGLPTGSRAFGTGVAGFEAELAASRSQGESDLELNALWYHEPDQEVVGLSESLGLDVSESAGVFLEGVETTRAGAVAGPAEGVLVDGGATWRMAHWTQLDLHAGAGRIAGDETGASLGFGVSRRW